MAGIETCRRDSSRGEQRGGCGRTGRLYTTQSINFGLVSVSIELKTTPCDPRQEVLTSVSRAARTYKAVPSARTLCIRSTVDSDKPPHSRPVVDGAVHPEHKSVTHQQHSCLPPKTQPLSQRRCQTHPRRKHGHPVVDDSAHVGDHRTFKFQASASSILLCSAACCSSSWSRSASGSPMAMLTSSKR